MKISASDVSHVNWTAMKEQLLKSASENIAKGIVEAQHVFEALKPGQAKTIKLNLATISVRRPKE
jgi:hypothetical protein